ncbi:hypothetical protein [Burkholderia ubonensis]|uniref:Uncharacterized protein n=1 Tax=Burkholderia ubonensis TaxID=101571 RepID=A0ABD4EAZ6_9BURK|nr:hypothetical protein [Burkholderia ubonensis]KVN92582.1 hypothetical protein WJ68_33725 [Burkholderia ubonensis]
MTTESKKSPAPEQASEAAPQRPRTENPTAEAIFEQAAGAGNLISSKFGDGKSRDDALTADQRQALGHAISEYFGRLDSDEGVRAPEGRILRAFDYCDSRNVDDLIDRAIVPALAASPVEQPAAAPIDGDREFHIAAVQLVNDMMDAWQSGTPYRSVSSGIHARINALLTAPIPDAAAPSPADELAAFEAWYERTCPISAEALRTGACDESIQESRDEMALGFSAGVAYARAAASPAADDRKYTQADMERYGRAVADAREKRVTTAAQAASPAAEAVAIPVEWDQDAAIEALSDFPKGSIWYEFLEEVGFDPTSGPIYVLTVQGRAMLDQLKSAYFAAPQPAQADASRTIPDECVASGASCSYAPEGRHGEMQRRYCGKAQSEAPAEAREPSAWVTPDGDRAITQAQKQGMLRDGGAGASSVRPYSIPCYASRAPADAGVAVTAAARDVLAERSRQVEVEAMTPAGDDQYDRRQLALAGASYALSGAGAIASDRSAPVVWPWSHEWWKPTTPRRDLVKAGALIVAEIERLDRRPDCVRAADEACEDVQKLVDGIAAARAQGGEQK